MHLENATDPRTRLFDRLTSLPVAITVVRYPAHATLDEVKALRGLNS